MRGMCERSVLVRAWNFAHRAADVTIHAPPAAPMPQTPMAVAESLDATTELSRVAAPQNVERHMLSACRGQCARSLTERVDVDTIASYSKRRLLGAFV